MASSTRRTFSGGPAPPPLNGRDDLDARGWGDRIRRHSLTHRQTPMPSRAMPPVRSEGVYFTRMCPYDVCSGAQSP
jgi:hypothetical protein